MKYKERIHKKLLELERKVKGSYITVALLGAGEAKINERRKIQQKLEKDGIVTLIPEDDFPEFAPSLFEEAILEKADIDLVFINVESWGTVAEFAHFYDKGNIAPKLRVLVHYYYHPLYGTSKSYLTDLYLTYLAKYSHVYAYSNRRGMFPTPKKIIATLARRYRELKFLGKI
jgi:hypothetical protein